MKKVLLDNNIMDKLIECTNEDILLIKNKCVLCVCDTFWQEVESISKKDMEKYNKIIKILNVFNKIDCKNLAFIDWNNKTNLQNSYGLKNWNEDSECSLAYLDFKDIHLYKNIHPNAINLKKEKDRHLALICSSHNIDCLVTEDNTFRKQYKNNGNLAFNFNEFLLYLKNF